jgi:hypothetical protein
MNRLLRLAAGSLLLLFASASALPVAAMPLFFAAPPAALKSANAKGVKSQATPVRFNAKEVLALRRNDQVQLTLPNGASHDLVVDLVSLHGDGIASWIGRIKGLGNHYRVVVTSGPAGSYGVIDTPQGSYRIVPGDGHDWLVDMTEEQMHMPLSFSLGDDARPVPRDQQKMSDFNPDNVRFIDAIEGLNAIASPKHLPGTAVEVDLMFVVTQGFATYYGANLATRLNFLVTRANTAYADSHIAITLRLVNTTTVNYADATNAGVALNAITSFCTGPPRFCSGFDSTAFGTIEATRTAAGADIVALMMAGSDFGGNGIAWAPSTPSADFMYSVTKGCMQACESVFIHEVGHNMGNQHDRATAQWQSWREQNPPGSGVFTSDFSGAGLAYGYAFCKIGDGALSCDPSLAPNLPGACLQDEQPECLTDDPSNFADIMAYFHGTTFSLSKFSNVDPSVTCRSLRGGNDGSERPCGVAQAADTATSMNNNRTALSALKPTATTNRTLAVNRTGTGTGTVTSAPAGINCGSTCAFDFADSAVVTLTAVPAAGSVFGGWSGGGCTGTGTCVVTLSAATTVTATFTATHTLTVNKAGSGTGAVTSAPAGISCGATCAFGFLSGTPVTLTAAASGGSVFTGWSGGGCSGTGTCQVTLSSATAMTATFVTAAGSPTGSANPASVPFGGQSVQTTSPGVPVVLTNIGAGTLTISNVAVNNAVFARAHNCTSSLNLGQSCTATVTFTPTAAGAAAGNLTFTTSAGNVVVPLSGTGEMSLVKHYYRAILNRAPEPGGQEFWEAESARLQALGASINEIWFVMANYFFNSPEYIAANKTDGQFLTDVYNTFFNRPPDGGGMAFWQSQMDAGLSREGVIFWFMFSNEFRTFTQGIFGSTAARPEVDMVMDLFRGILNRFPDTAAFNAFVGTLRTAQCQGAGQVYTAVNDMSYFFLFGSTEYGNRARNNTQYVSDMYNAFLRRGGADSEVGFWINQLNTDAKDRNTVRADFMASPEFGARVQAVIGAGCAN